MISPLSQRPLYLDVAEQIRELIYREALKPGDWIDETLLCNQLEISRTPLREALKVLHAENLVELVQPLTDFMTFLASLASITIDGATLHFMLPSNDTDDDKDFVDELRSRMTETQPADANDA